jgi:AraC-like DNA-binding protein
MSAFERVGVEIDVSRKSCRANRASCDPHYHNALEISYVISGEVDFFVRDQTFTAGPGDVIFVNTFEVHNRIVNDKVHDKILLTYNPAFLENGFRSQIPDVFSMLDSQMQGCRLLSLPPLMRRDTERLLEDMAAAAGEGRRYAPVYLRAYLTIFLTGIAERIEALVAAGFTPADGNNHLRGIIRYIKENLDSRLTLDMIAGRFHTDKFYLCRYFRKHTGLSVMDYVGRLRIVEAEKLIVKGKSSITDISLMVGFGDISSFERAFKRYTGITPREYRGRNALRRDPSDFSVWKRTPEADEDARFA